MNRQMTGWMFVVAQVALLLLIVVAPSGNDWATPAWLTGLGWIISIGGVGIALAASVRLGSALTPTPVPSSRGELATQGMYTYVRHPIYTGVLAIVLGIVLRSGSVATAMIGVVLLAFFSVKARWEEQRLREHYPGYGEYAMVTPRFVPRPSALLRERGS
ncbi:MAG: isoprenylcysteine carboxylmethyltransferase family protein [Acidimicrobiia bacterium]|nr:isoprenylcysteine carboxylmethyltransferase family protein [Acidimicrobiia bacterium]